LRRPFITDARPLVLLVALLACKPAQPSAVTTSAPSRSSGPAWAEQLLPERAGPFVAGAPVEAGDGYVRRTYSLGDKRVEVTVARMGGGTATFASWAAGSVGYPPAVLTVPPDQAIGFFTCAVGSQESVCDVHIQFRTGFHVEGMGNGRVSKSDLTQLLAHLPLSILTDPAASTI
jgi:hypothetical protein